MPLREGSSDEAVNANIKTLMDEGYEQTQAVAIAHHFAGRRPRAKTQKNDAPAEVFKVVGRGRMLLVKGAPTATELLRGEPFVNDERDALQKHLLEPLALSRADCMLAWCDPMHGGDQALDDFVQATKPDVVVCLSDELVLLKEAGRWNFPTLEELCAESRKFAEEATRKLTAIRKRLDGTAARGQYYVQLVNKGATPSDRRTILTPIHKASPIKQIVYGAVLDPYQVDTQQDWCPPREIEDTAHGFLEKSGFVGLQHTQVAPDAKVVESFVEQYPSESDRAKAHANKPHRVYARKFGDDVVHSGAWVIGVKLSDRLWQQYQAGEIAAFSIEGFGKREPVEKEAMPLVTFVEIGELGNVATGRTSHEAR